MPPGPYPVRVYVFETFGDTEVEPSSATEPTPLSIETDVALVVVHESVEEPPVVIDEGEAESVHAGVGLGIVTVIVVWQVLVTPAEFATVIVYVRVPGTEIAVAPEAIGVTAPTPWSIVADTALALVHESADAEPGATDDGVAESVHDGAFGATGSTVIVAWQITEPPAPVAFKRYVCVPAESADWKVYAPFNPGDGMLGELIVGTRVSDVAFVVFHETPVEERFNEQTGTGCGVTVIVCWQVTVPPGPLAVSVYVLDVGGYTRSELFALTPPIP